MKLITTRTYGNGYGYNNPSIEYVGLINDEATYAYKLRYLMYAFPVRKNQ